MTLQAVNCANGESVASTEAQASDKSHVLDALSKAASELRKKLGESLNTVKKLDMPLEDAATPSLEALQAFSLGIKTMDETFDCGSRDTFVPACDQARPGFCFGLCRCLRTAIQIWGKTAWHLRICGRHLNCLGA